MSVIIIISNIEGGVMMSAFWMIILGGVVLIALFKLVPYVLAKGITKLIDKRNN